jgi:hypothetical protein
MYDLLIVTYNCAPGAVHAIQHDWILHLFDPATMRESGRPPGVKHADVVPHDRVESALFEQIKKHMDGFSKIVIVDNAMRPQISVDDLFSFEKKFGNNWLMNGVKLEPHISENGFIPERYAVDGLMVNSGKLTACELNMLAEQKVGHVSFPFFSRIIHRRRSKCLEVRSKGLIRKRRSVNILL